MQRSNHRVPKTTLNGSGSPRQLSAGDCDNMTGATGDASRPIPVNLPGTATFRAGRAIP
jgi:hypothetical protein